MSFSVETEREDDGRWIAEVVELPGVLAYGTTRDEAVANAEALAVRVAADRTPYPAAPPEWLQERRDGRARR
jgi:predicted RNase H-like HicB family nuclease